MKTKTVFRAGGENYTRDDLMQMEPVALRALFRERVHHGIEVRLYPVLLQNREVPADFGGEVRLLLEVWRERGLPEDEPDIEWGNKYLELATKLENGERLNIELPPKPEPFSLNEMPVVEKLIWERKSIREWEKREVPDHLIERVLEAGRAAPLACNLAVVRFVVLRTEAEIKTIVSDIPTPPGHCVIIVIGYDNRVYPVVGHDRFVPHNQILDCSAAADHMLLMAHALGLGGVWLTQTEKVSQRFKEKSGVPSCFQPVLHIALGWPATGTIKTQRPPLKEMVIKATVGS